VGVREALFEQITHFELVEKIPATNVDVPGYPPERAC
jgi:hypothetical protein